MKARDVQILGTETLWGKPKRFSKKINVRVGLKKIVEISNKHLNTSDLRKTHKAVGGDTHKGGDRETHKCGRGRGTEKRTNGWKAEKLTRGRMENCTILMVPT